MTNGELVSRVINAIKALNKDEHVSRRHILKTARSKARFYIAQKLTENSTIRISELYKTIPCFQLEEVDTISCCDILEFKTCKQLMRSKKKLPELIYNKHGLPILTITDVDNNQDFTFVQPKVYRLNKNRPFFGEVEQFLYYIHDDYLYIPDQTIELVSIELMTMEEEKLSELSSCGKGGNSEGCTSVWDFDFNCPKNILELVIRETIQEIMGSKQIVPDENPNMDANLRSSTTV